MGGGGEEGDVLTYKFKEGFLCLGRLEPVYRQRGSMQGRGKVCGWWGGG